MKVLFLDIDGVVNSEEYFKKRSKGEHPTDIDNYMALLVYRITEATGCKIVLSSSWRGYAPGEAEIERMIGIKLHDRTPRGRARRNQADQLEHVERGEEIKQWLDAHPEVTRYAILDDDSDMLDEQLPNFFKTEWKVGITDEIAARVIAHLNS